MQIHDCMKRTAETVNEALRRLYAAHGQPQAHLYDAMCYSLLAGGKRLRPFLTLEFCRACGGAEETALPAALAVEMIHTYSLIHDDLPCMDNDDYRRGKPTNHKVYGEAVACLAGDALLTDAFSVLAAGNLSAETKCRCVSVLSENAGSYGMVGGQVLDIEAETRECTPEDVRAIQSRKTGCLIRAACQMGVLCGGGSEDQFAAAGAYADAIGLAFQIRDDVLDVTSDLATMGKGVGSDEKKNTFVKLYGVDGCTQMIREETDRAVAALAPFPMRETLADLAVALAARTH